MAIYGDNPVADINLFLDGDNTIAVGAANPLPITVAAGSSNLDGQVRVAQVLTLFDGKILNAEDSLKWDTKGTGTATFSGNAMTLAVDAGEYVIRSGRNYCPYFPGKPQVIEGTFTNFAAESEVTKRFGYFSSNAVAPYDSSKDGFWVESGDGTYKLVTSRLGTVTHSIDWTAWDNYAAVSSYDWTKFSVAKGEFLWLGGAGLRLFLVVSGVFTLLHTIADHAGYADGLIFSSPNQPARYEIRSTGGAGSITAVCSQVSAEGATAAESGQGLIIKSAGIATNAVGTLYALAGVRKIAAYRNHFIPVTKFGVTQVAGNTEAGFLYLLHNPTLSADLTWSASSRIEEGVATNQTVTNVGRIIDAIPVSGSAVVGAAPNAALRVLGVGLDNTMSTLVLAYSPLTINQSVAGCLQVIEY